MTNEEYKRARKTLLFVLRERNCPDCGAKLVDECPAAYRGHFRCVACDRCWREQDGSARSCRIGPRQRKRLLKLLGGFEEKGSGI